MDTTSPAQPSVDLSVSYHLPVHRNVSVTGIGSADLKSTDSVWAEGEIIRIPMAALAPDADIDKVFRRWFDNNSKCEVTPMKNNIGNFENPMQLLKFRDVNMHYVGAYLTEGNLTVTDEGIIITSKLKPTGRFGEKLRRYMTLVEEVVIRPRFLVDSNGLITGVPAWDLVLPDQWEVTSRGRQAVYNEPTHPDFVKAHGLIHEKCKEDGLDYAVDYEEGQDMWNISIRHMDHDRWFRTGDGNLSSVVEEALDHLNISGD